FGGELYVPEHVIDGTSASGPASQTTLVLLGVTFSCGSASFVNVTLVAVCRLLVPAFQVPDTKSGGVPVPPTICQSPLLLLASVMSVQNSPGAIGRPAKSQPAGHVFAPVCIGRLELTGPPIHAA